MSKYIALSPPPCFSTSLEYPSVHLENASKWGNYHLSPATCCFAIWVTLMLPSISTHPPPLINEATGWCLPHWT